MIAWIFDVDGVITNPSAKKITERQMLDSIEEKLDRKDVVAFNTGRSLSWMTDKIINHLLEKDKDKKVFNNFFAVGEKGGVWLTISENGIIIQHKDDLISVPSFLKNKVKTLIETKYANSMFYDESKLTMISTEMKNGYSVKEYRKLQIGLVKALNNLLATNGLIRILNIDPSTIATDIQNKNVGKGFAVKRILAWLKKKDINPKQFIAFGDSNRDIEMAEEINKINLPVRFVFVGDSVELQKKNYPFSVIFTKEKYEKGTLEYLKTQKPVRVHL